MAETAEVRTLKTRILHLHGRWCTAGAPSAGTGKDHRFLLIDGIQWAPQHFLQRRNGFAAICSTELELQDLYDLPQGELDLVMAETAEIFFGPSIRH